MNDVELIADNNRNLNRQLCTFYRIAEKINTIIFTQKIKDMLTSKETNNVKIYETEVRPIITYAVETRADIKKTGQILIMWK